MFTRVLIANRGEIALRIIRSCRELGISPVAVYSDADASAPFVRAADEAIRIGTAPSADSYLRGDRIIEAAVATGAEAIHPGYGFLSEREWFARAVLDAGIVFVGPSAEAIALMGNKTSARSVAIRAGVPVVPGTADIITSAEGARAVTGELGFPVLIKAAAGGGGKGMRVVESEAELDNAIDSARREAKNAFGDDSVYVEKYIPGPRHVEIQILGDQHGHVLHLGERECSVQRRHQKVVEEAPSIALSPELRADMGATAVRAAVAAGYTNAGTCEFLLDREGNYYFLEMNTRLQVEHPVTELVTGIDIVAWQLRIAAGERLSIAQREVVPRGWAIECRITSESALDGFMPSTGVIEQLVVPQGAGIRWDAGIDVGSDVGLYYDAMLAKLIVHAPDRKAAVSRMLRALRELSIVGVDTTREFLIRLLEDPEFQSGEVDVQWLERRVDSLVFVRPATQKLLAAAAAAAMLYGRGRRASAPIVESDAAGSREGWPRTSWRFGHRDS